MSVLVPIMMFGWLPFVLFLFAAQPARRAVLVGMIGAWLFLPMRGYHIGVLPDYTKTTAPCIAILLGTLLFAPQNLLGFRPRWADLALLVFSITPMFSSLTNGLGPYDGLSNCLRAFMNWGLPYLIGRMYFRDLQSLRDLALGLLLGGLIYVPLWLYEIRMSPLLHSMLYGYFPHDFGQTKRGGGWRPTVFMQHGLMLSMWMCAASVVGLWLWHAGGLRRLWSRPTAWFLIALVGTTVLCKSAGATALLLLGALTLWAARQMRKNWPLLLLVLAPALYMGVRTPGLWSGDLLVHVAQLYDEERADSLETRLFSEDHLIQRALQQPMFGWGGWGRGFIGERDEETGRAVIQDGFWVIIFTQYGLVGLCSFTLLMLLPALTAVWRLPRGAHQMTMFAAPAALAVVVALYVIDCLFNAMPSPIYVMCAGALTSAAASFEWRSASRAHANVVSRGIPNSAGGVARGGMPA